MSQITDLIKLAREEKISMKDLADKMQEYYDKEASRLSFGLVYESHLPELFEIANHKIRKGDIVSFRSERGQFAPSSSQLWSVTKTYTHDDVLCADLEVVTPERDDNHNETQEETQTGVDVDRLIKIVSQEDIIYPGLESDGEVVGDENNDTYHSVICSENYDALRMLNGTDMIGKVDCIYIDPPYNTGNKDWIYNNDYVDGSDTFRSSAFMNFLERRLLEAKTLLNPNDSVLIVTIDEKEYLNVGMLLRQVFTGARIQMVSSVINPTGVARDGELARTDEYIYIVQLGTYRSPKINRKWGNLEENSSTKKAKPYWRNLMRSGSRSTRRDSPGCFYPISIKETSEGLVFENIGKTIPFDEDYDEELIEKESRSINTILPFQTEEVEGCWQLSPSVLENCIDKGVVRIRGSFESPIIQYLARGEQAKIESGIFTKTGEEPSGAGIFESDTEDETHVTTQWNVKSHSARHYGASIINAFHGEKRFDFPKSLYAVEDVIRFFVKNKSNATIIDFFGGSGTTAHAVMRLNEQDGGHRKSITITNNEVSLQNNKKFSAQGLQSGDPEWESHGVYEYATKPRLTAAITGKTASSGYTEDVQGYYKYNDFQDEYAIGDPIPKDKAKQFKDGLKQNVRFFKIKYLNYRDIFLDNADEQLYPLVWLEQGQRGDIPSRIKKYFIHDNYAIVKKLSKLDEMMELCSNSIDTIYAHCDEHTAAQLQRSVDASIEVVPLWDLYIQRMKTHTNK